jgi:hypothetical protein
MRVRSAQRKPPASPPGVLVYLTMSNLAPINSKLDQQLQDEVRQRIIRGDRDAEIMRFLQDEHAISLTKTALRRYRQDPRVIEEMNRRDAEVFQAGYASRIRRLQAMDRVAEATLERLFSDPRTRRFREDLSARDINDLTSALDRQMSAISRLVDAAEGRHVTAILQQSAVNNFAILDSAGVSEAQIIEALKRKQEEAAKVIDGDFQSLP